MAEELSQKEFVARFGEGHHVSIMVDRRSYKVMMVNRRSPEVKEWLDQNANAFYYIDHTDLRVVFSDEADAIGFAIYIEP